MSGANRYPQIVVASVDPGGKYTQHYPKPNHDDLLNRRVTSPEYGPGRVVAVLPIGIQVWYDRPLTGTVDTHMLVHDPSYVERWLDQQ